MSTTTSTTMTETGLKLVSLVIVYVFAFYKQSKEECQFKAFVTQFSNPSSVFISSSKTRLSLINIFLFNLCSEDFD